MVGVGARGPEFARTRRLRPWTPSPDPSPAGCGSDSIAARDPGRRKYSPRLETSNSAPEGRIPDRTGLVRI